MADINWGSILDKAKKYMQNDKVQKRVEKITDSIVMGTAKGASSSSKTPSEAAQKFIEVLQREIESHGVSEGNGGLSNGGLGSSAIVALTKLDHGSPYKVGKNKYKIEVWFTEDLSRESLAPDKYDGVDNIAALLNSGYSAGHATYGIWKGHGDERVASLTKRDGAHFIENAIRDYMGNYASDYGVIDIEYNEVYR